MQILESSLLGEFIGYLRANWSSRSRVDQRRRRLRQLVTKVRAVTDTAAPAVRDGSLAAWLQILREQALHGQQVLDAARCDAPAVASSTRRFLSGIKGLVVCSPDVDRLTEAVEELERLAGPGGDLDLFVKLLRLDETRGGSAMDVDRSPASGSPRASCSSSGDPELPVMGAKRKRACCSSDADHHSAGQPDRIDNRKRRVLAWARPHSWLPPFCGVFGAPPPPPPRRQCARTVALAMVRLRRRRRQPALGKQLSRLSL